MNEHIIIGDSTLGPRVGEGLFSNAWTFNKGDDICTYEGDLLEMDVAAESNSDYLFKINKDWVMDAQDPDSCYGRYLNDPIFLSKVNAKIKANTRDLTAKVIATKKIKAGDEIFTSYGSDYWHDIDKYNLLNKRQQNYLYENGTRKFQKWVDGL